MIPPIKTGLHTCPREFVSVSQSKLRYITSEYLASSQKAFDSGIVSLALSEDTKNSCMKGD